MTLRQLQIFIVVANRLNLRVAAEDLHIAQSSISQHLRLLQEEFGKELHRKVGSGIELTPTGALFLKEAKSISARIENLRVKLRSNFAEPAGSSLTVGGSFSASTTYLPFLLALFKKNHENVRLKLRTDDGWTIAGKILSGDVDVALVHNHPGYHQLATETYANEPVVACVSPNHPLAKKTSLSLDDVRKFGFITRRAPNKVGKSHQFVESLDRKGFTAKVIMECDTAEAKKSAVKNQMGIGMMFRTAVQDDLEKRELVELRLPGIKLVRKSYILYHKTRPLTPAARDFIELLRSYRDKINHTREDRRKTPTLLSGTSL